MDRLALAHVSVLVQDHDDVSSLGADDGTCSDERNVNQLMVVNALNVDKLTGFINNPDVVASNATIGTSINEGSTSG
jgi:hypothetical protein